jgi:hypothetical protein
MSLKSDKARLLGLLGVFAVLALIAFGLSSMLSIAGGEFHETLEFSSASPDGQVIAAVFHGSSGATSSAAHVHLRRTRSRFRVSRGGTVLAPVIFAADDTHSINLKWISNDHLQITCAEITGQNVTTWEGVRVTIRGR